MNKKKIIFMGTPDFAVSALDVLHNSNYEIVAVVTQPDRPKGRGKKIIYSPVKELALRLGYNVLQPVTIKNDEFFDTINKLNPDFIVVVAYGKILPKKILSVPSLGCINIHASVLPKYRGPAPIQRVIMDCEKKTGVSIMYMDEGLDTGDIILISEIDIEPYDTTVTLSEKLSALGANSLIQALESIEDGSAKPVSQDNSAKSYAPLIEKKEGLINWEQDANKIEAKIRGLQPWPGAYTFYNDRRLKIFKAKVVKKDFNAKSGTVLESFADELEIATKKDALSICEIQGASGKRLLIKDFLRGFSIKPGSIFK